MLLNEAAEEIWESFLRRTLYAELLFGLFQGGST